MLKVNLKKVKFYGDRLDDGVVQMSFTLPVQASPEAKEAARRLVERHGFERVSIATMEPMGKGFSYFVAYGHSKESIDLTKIHVPKVEMPEMDYAELVGYMALHLEKPIVVIGAATGSDAHTVGIDAIMNMKGFAGDYGLERYPLFKTYNLRSQLTNRQLIDKAAEFGADAILISQVVTQRDSHVQNLKDFHDLFAADKRLSRHHTIIIVGGPRLDHAHALKLGFDAGFGVGTKPSQVACFIVHEFMKRHGIRGRKGAEPAAEGKPVPPPRHPAAHAPAPHHEARHPASHREARHPAPPPASAPEPGELRAAPQSEAEGAPQKKRRRRGRRGGRRHRRREGQTTSTA